MSKAPEGLFLQAAQKKIRFDSNRGPLMVEDLFEMNLTSKGGFDLDSVARLTNQQLKAQTEESFVATKSNPLKALLETKLEIVKYVIELKQAELEESRTRNAKLAEKRRILEALENVDNRELQSATREDLMKRLEAIGI